MNTLRKLIKNRMETANNSKYTISGERTILYSIVQYVILLLFVTLYIFNITKYFWTLPAPSDPLQYLGPVSWGTTWAYWPWLDRINLAVNLRLFTILFPKAYIGGMVYIGFINTIILTVSLIWSFKKSGFWAAFLIGIFINSSFLMLGWSTYIYPDQTVALYALLTFVTYFWDTKSKRYFSLALLAGVFAALASLTKATGVVVPIFFIAYCIINKDWKNLIRFCSGIIVGSCIVFILFISLFDWHCFVNTFQHFFHGSLRNNITVGTGISGAAYFHEIILSIKYFPFVALFFAAGAYKNKNSRNLFFLAWLNILFVTVVRMFSPSISSYIYTAYVFTCLGLSIYISDLINSKDGRDGKAISKIILIITSVAAIIFIIIGLQIGIKYSPVKAFDYGYNYLKPLDIYNANNLPYPSLIKRLYSFSPLIILGSLAYVLVAKAKKAIILFALIVALMASFLNGGLAYRKATFDREEADFFYKNAPILNLVPAKTFTVYVESWNRHNYSFEILWIYRVFFDEKYQRVFEPKYKSQYLNEYEVVGNIAYISKEEGLSSGVRGPLLLTDNPRVVYKYYPNALKIKSFYDQSAQNLVLLDISNKAIQKKILFTFDLDLKKWQGTNYEIDMGDLNKVLPPLQIVGVRGDFSFIYDPLNGKSSMRTAMKKSDSSEQSLINFGYWLKSEIGKLNDTSGLYLTFDIAVNLLKEGGTHTLFIQDQIGEGWEKINIPLDKKGIRAYTLTKVLRSNVSSVIAGIGFVPQTEGDWIEINKIKLTIWTISQNSD